MGERCPRPKLRAPQFTQLDQDPQTAPARQGASTAPTAIMGSGEPTAGRQDSRVFLWGAGKPGIVIIRPDTIPVPLS